MVAAPSPSAPPGNPSNSGPGRCPRMGMNGYKRNGQISTFFIEGVKLFARGACVVIDDIITNQGGSIDEDWMLGGWKNCLLSITLGFLVVFLTQIYQCLA